MNVIIVSAIDPFKTKPGGTRPYILNIIKALSTKGIKFSLWGVSYNEKYDLKYDFEFIPLVKSKKTSNYEFIAHIIYRILFEGVPRDSIVHAQRTDIMFPFVLLGIKNPKIVTIHGHNSESTLIYKKGIILGNILKVINQFVVYRIDKIITVDNRTKEYYIQKFPGISDKLEVIPISIDTTIFKPMDKISLRKKYSFGEQDKIIMYIGRHNKEKRLELLIEAFKLTKEKVPDCKLVLVGDGPEKKKLKYRTQDLDNVIYIDTVEHKYIPELLNCADVFALCSVFEGMPNVILESLACGVPAVSTDVGDVGRIIKNNENGYIIENATEGEISDKLKKILLNDCHITKEKCMQSMNIFSHEQVGESIRRVYYEVLQEK